MSSFNTTVLDAPDQRLRKIYLKASMGAPLSDSDYNRVAQRQGVEAQNLATGGANMNLNSARDLNGKLASGSYMYQGKPSPDAVEAAGKAKLLNDQLRAQQAEEEKNQKPVMDSKGLTSSTTGKNPATTSPATPSVKPTLPTAPVAKPTSTTAPVAKPPVTASSEFDMLNQDANSYNADPTQSPIERLSRSMRFNAFGKLPTYNA